jgi:hypothetical protein
MATSILDAPAFVQAGSALSDELGRKPVSIATGANRAEKLVEETASTHGARSLVPGTTANALARSIRCKTLAAASVTLRLRANSLRTAHALASSKLRRSDKSHETVTAEGAPPCNADRCGDHRGRSAIRRYAGLHWSCRTIATCASRIHAQ